MDDSEEAPANDDYEAQVGDASGALQHSLPTDERVRAELRQVIAELTALQAQVAEWSECHHLLHEVLAAFSLFHARLISSGEDGSSAAGRQALLQNWRLCQDRLDTLVDFAEEIDHIGNPFRREGRQLRGERWVVEIVALQLLLEDALKEDNPSPESLIELGEAFNSACHRHLALADRKLRTVVDKLQRLSAYLLGGMA
jgi:hypothetical protein